MPTAAKAKSYGITKEQYSLWRNAALAKGEASLELRISAEPKENFLKAKRSFVKSLVNYKHRDLRYRKAFKPLKILEILEPEFTTVKVILEKKENAKR